MRGLAVAAVVLVALSGTARAADAELDALLDHARREKAALRYQEGLATLDRALRLGKSGPAQLVDIHRAAGEMAAGLGDAAAAQAHFERWLVLEPDAALPPGTSPKITAPFAAARARLAGLPALAVRFEPEAGAAPAITMIVDGDPLGQVAGARARVRGGAGGESVVEARGGGRQRLALPDGGPLRVVAAALDQFGNELVVQGSWQAPILIDGSRSRPSTTTPPPSRPLYARWWVYGAAGLGVGVAGVVFAAKVDAAQQEFDQITANSSSHQLADAEAVARRGRRYAWLANGSFAAAGVLGIVSGVLLVRQLGEEPAGVTLSPTPTADGAGWGVMASGTF
jgi:hypothetical protein